MNEFTKETIIKDLCKKLGLDYETENSVTLELMFDCYLTGYQDGIKDKTIYVKPLI